MKKSAPVRMLCTYRLKDGSEADFLRLLDSHWPALRDAGLATGEQAQVFQAKDKAGRTIFIEMFSWNDPDSPGVAHQTPEVMSVWEPMGALTEEMNFWSIEPVAMSFDKT
jgi:hypothetical protein